MNENEIRTLTTAVEAGLWGLVVKALAHEEGGGATLATLGKVRSGQAEVECSVRFHREGVTYRGDYVSHGNRSHLFTVNVAYPPDTGTTPEGSA